VKQLQAIAGALSISVLAGCAGNAVQSKPVVPPAVLALQPPPPNVDAGQQLHTLLDSEWQRYLRETPEMATTVGDHRYDDRWSDLSLQAINASHEADLMALQRLLEIDRERLNIPDQLNYDLFKLELSKAVEANRYHHYLLSLNHMGGVQTANQITEIIQFQTERDYRNWIGRIRALGTLVDQNIALLKAGIAEGRTQPKVIMQRIPVQIDKQIVANPEQSPYYAPFKTLPDSLPAAVQADLRAQAQAAIKETVVPAYRRFKTMFVGEYLPACRDSIGASALPEGRDDYAFSVRMHTTTTMTPDEIHALGLSEVRRIRAEMEKVKAQIKFQGDLQAFFRYLRTDKRFFYTNGEDLLASYRAIAKRVDQELPRLFATLPRQPYGVKPILPEVAPYTTTAYYQPGAADGTRAGTFYVNLYKPLSRPKWEQEALTLHESVPGHHLQLALQQELGTLPDFRRQAGYTAFIEGWGLYAESLGPELGMFQDPYSKFGQLTYEMWRAVRLVVDTGMHAKGWSRQQAIDFFKANTPRAELDIVNEIDRYIAWPGQALAYKIGELKIKELRARASTQLGDRFDVRAFHDLVLGAGAIPLEVLEKRVDSWIAMQLETKLAAKTKD